MGIENDSILLAYIKNIYTTILERGLEGTYIYVCNDSLRNYLKQFFLLLSIIQRSYYLQKKLKQSRSVKILYQKTNFPNIFHYIQFKQHVAILERVMK